MLCKPQLSVVSVSPFHANYLQMVKVTNPNISTAEKEKCLAVVKKHAPVTSALAVPMETDETVDLKHNYSPQTPMLSNKVIPHIKTEVIDLTGDDTGVKAERNITVLHSESNTDLSKGVKDIKIEPEVETETASTVDAINKDLDDEQDSVHESMEVQISISSEAEGVSTIVPTTAATTDVTKPLMIETKFSISPGPGSESTDTASEVGSCFSSPSSSTMGTSAQNSPNVSFGEKNPGKQGKQHYWSLGLLPTLQGVMWGSVQYMGCEVLAESPIDVTDPK